MVHPMRMRTHYGCPSVGVSPNARAEAPNAVSKSAICSGAGQFDGSSDFVMGNKSRNRSCICSGGLASEMDRWERSLKTDGRVLLITAHPDDESMFFAPTVITLTQANVEVFLLCLSEGHFILTKYTAKNRCMYTIQPN